MEQSAGRARISAYLSYAFRVVLGAMFLYTGVVHFLDPKGFAEAVANYRILPVVLVNPFSVGLPFVEMITGIALLLGTFIPGSLLIISGLLFMFALALGIALFHGLDISCGCFTTTKEAQRISWIYLVRDLSLLAITVFIFYFDMGLASITKLWSTKR
ncbi:MAG: MauE/DoxX family redox-associated membrane protein [Desulfomonilia bacterium]